MTVEMDSSKQNETTRVSLTLNSEDVNDITYTEKYEGEQKKALRNGKITNYDHAILIIGFYPKIKTKELVWLKQDSIVTSSD